MSGELVALMGSVLIVALGIFLVTFVIEFNKKQQWHYKQKELMNAQFDQALLQSRLEIQEQTFKQISQEIHDNIGQVLTLVKLHLNNVGHVSEPDKNTLDSAKDMLTKAIQDLRDLSKTLNSDTIERIGIIKSIEMELQLLEKLTNIKTTNYFDGPATEIKPEVELILFRIVQEGIHNIIKHAKANIVHVSGTMSGNDFELCIKDDGIGFNPEEKFNKGSGINNLQHRCKLIGASFKIDSKENMGTTISISLPVIPEKN